MTARDIKTQDLINKDPTTRYPATRSLNCIPRSAEPRRHGLALVILGKGVGMPIALAIATLLRA